ncbi:hypothetical protein [Emticicia sp. 17c]|uniref:hypothetical protein n=1 Tax=Emticicia sp. 17c TaxID=3127704 RepID=UPI00301C4A06
MKNQSKLRTLTLIGIFAFLALSLSSCVYSSRPYGYDRPVYVHRHYSRPYVRVQPRVYVVPKHDRYRHHDRRHYDNSRRSRGRY